MKKLTKDIKNPNINPVKNKVIFINLRPKKHKKNPITTKNIIPIHLLLLKKFQMLE